MLGRKQLVSCLLLSVVSLGFLVSQANAASIQQIAFFYYDGYVRLTAGRFSGAIQPAQVVLGLGGGIFSDFLGFETHGYWNVDFVCDAIVIPGGDGSVGASCGGSGAYAKFWTEGLFVDSGFHFGAPATLQFYFPYVRGQFVGVLVSVAIP